MDNIACPAKVRSKFTVLFILVTLLSICQGKLYFYIYEWPDYFSDVWPPHHAALVDKSPYSHTFRSNYSGVGDILEPSIGYFSTWQFALYKLTMARMRVSEHRTMDPAQATTFIIPFDMGVHSFIDHNNGKARVASPHGWRAIEYLKEKIASAPEIYWKNRGHDHFVIYSITSYQISGIGSKVFMTELCENCSVITIETTPTFTARKYYSGKSKKWWFAVPYPSSFHWWEGITRLPWIRDPVADPERSILSVFIGSVKTENPNSNKLRQRLHKDCNEASDVCQWHNTAHSCSGMVNSSDNMLLYRKSVFCLAPPGDSLTRKSLFDSLLTGCIPVIFAKATINQYLWHIPADIIDQVSVYIPQQSIVEHGVNFISVLQGISEERIKITQDKIEELAPSLQYSVVPMMYQQQQRFNTSDDLLRKKDPVLTVGGHVRPHVVPDGLKQVSLSIPPLVWKPPVPDAVDIIIDRILNRTTVEPMNGFTKEDFARLTEIRDNALLVDPSYLGLIEHATPPAHKHKHAASAAKAKSERIRQEALAAAEAATAPVASVALPTKVEWS